MRPIFPGIEIDSVKTSERALTLDKFPTLSEKAGLSLISTRVVAQSVELVIKNVNKQHLIIKFMADPLCE
jgi:hypothetical protein